MQKWQRVAAPALVARERADYHLPESAQVGVVAVAGIDEQQCCRCTHEMLTSRAQSNPTQYSKRTNGDVRAAWTWVQLKMGVASTALLLAELPCKPLARIAGRGDVSL